MSTQHERLCGQRIWNSNNKMIKVGISIKSIPTCFLFTLKCMTVCNSCHGLKKNCTTLSLNFLGNEHLVLFCEFYLIIVFDLKAKCTINNFRMFMFDSNHSLLYIPMHCKIKKSLRSSF